MENILIVILMIVWAISISLTALITANFCGNKKKNSVKPQTEQKPLMTERDIKEFENFLTYNGRPQEDE